MTSSPPQNNNNNSNQPSYVLPPSPGSNGILSILANAANMSDSQFPATVSFPPSPPRESIAFPEYTPITIRRVATANEGTSTYETRALDQMPFFALRIRGSAASGSDEPEQTREMHIGQSITPQEALIRDIEARVGQRRPSPQSQNAYETLPRNMDAGTNTRPEFAMDADHVHIEPEAFQSQRPHIWRGLQALQNNSDGSLQEHGHRRLLHTRAVPPTDIFSALGLDFESATSFRMPVTLGLTRPNPSPSQPYENAPFRNKQVWQLNCKYCNKLLCMRGMKAVLLADTRVELYSTDFPPMGVNVVFEDQVTRNCQCKIKETACLGCGNTVGYFVVQPCTRCLQSGNNGHFWMFQTEAVAPYLRMTSKNLVQSWKDLPRGEADKELNVSERNPSALYYEETCR